MVRTLFNKYAIYLLISILIASLILALAAFWIHPAYAASPNKPDWTCPKCTLVGYVTECDRCGGAKPHLLIDYYRCVECDGQVTYITSESCVNWC
jgi:hypothetical protein